MSTVFKKTEPPGVLKPDKLKIPPFEERRVGHLGIKDMRVQLQTTQINEPSIEFPTDEVIIYIDIANTSKYEIPKDINFTLTIRRNNQLIRTVPFVYTKDWTYMFTDTFTHSIPVIYNATINCDDHSWTDSKLADKSIKINEMELHPSGNPEFSISVFEIKRFWHQIEDKFKGYHRFSADVSNNGNGYAAEDSNISFFTDTGTIASIPVKVNGFPGPNTWKRFSIGIKNESLPSGQHSVKVKIDPAKNEINKENNISGNSELINNTLFPILNELFNLTIELRSEYKKIHFNIGIKNKYAQFFNNLRVMLVKDNTIIQQWTPIGLAPYGEASLNYREEITRPEVIFKEETYKVFITPDIASSVPLEDSYLALASIELIKAEINEVLLKNLVADLMAKQISERDNSISVKSEDLNFEIHDTYILLTMKGKKALTGKDAEFTLRLKFYPNVKNGKLELDILEHPDIHFSLGIFDWLIPILLPFFYDIAKAAIINVLESKFPESLIVEANQLPLVPVATSLFEGQLVVVGLK